MKKTAVFVMIFMLMFTLTVSAAENLESVLGDEIKEQGLWNGKKGIIFADKVNFEEESLLVVSVENTDVICKVYNNTDGIQLTDTLILNCAAGVCRLVEVKSGEKCYLMFSRGGTDEFYTIRNDAFITESVTDYFPVTGIAVSGKGKITPSSSRDKIFNFLNRLKEETIASYSLTNKINQLDSGEADRIKLTLTACADIMTFDIKDYDYDRLFKYVLYTHENFKILTDIPSDTGESGTLGYSSVHLTGGDYIDYIMRSVFRVEPEKPPVNALTNRGFCYNDGYYLYTGGFNAYFSTEIKDLVAAFDLGGGVIYVVFSDIYSQGDDKFYEYSYAILQKSGEGYSLLRLGMGKSLPSEGEIRSYSPFSAYHDNLWKGNTKNGSGADNDGINAIAMVIMLVIISVGIVGIVCSITAIIKSWK